MDHKNLARSYLKHLNEHGNISVIQQRLLCYFQSHKLDFTRPLIEMFEFIDDLEFIKLRDYIEWNCDKDLFDKYSTKSDSNARYYEVVTGSDMYFQAINEILSDIKESSVLEEYKSILFDTPINAETVQFYPIGKYSKTRLRQRSKVASLIFNHLGFNRVSYNSSSKRLMYLPLHSKKPKIIQFSSNSSPSFMTLDVFIRALSSLISESVVESDTYEVLYEYFNPKDMIESQIIQFNDCYISNGKIRKGIPSANDLPKAFIDRNIYQVVSSGKCNRDTTRIKQLLMHLVDYDESSYTRILSTLSVVFLNSASYKKKFNSIAQFYGPSGENGKSLFLDLLTRAVNSNNVCSFKIADLNNDKTLFSISNSLIALDADSSNKHITDDAASNFKKITSGELLDIKKLYVQESSQSEIFTMLVTASNNLPTSSDKSSAYTRRLDIVKCSSRLPEARFFEGLSASEITEWFDYINSDEAAQTLLEMLILESQRIKHSNSLPAKSEAMVNLIHSFNEDNNSAEAYVEDVTIENIIGKSSKTVKDEYETWCSDNDMIPLKSKFKHYLEERYGLSVKRTKACVNYSDLRVVRTVLVEHKYVRAYVPVDEQEYLLQVQRLNAYNSSSQVTQNEAIKSLAEQVKESE